MNSPGVRFPPPVLFVAGLGLGWLIDARVRRWTITMSPSASDVRVMAGWAAVTLGAALIVWGMVTFLRARTAIIPNQPASRIVNSGPYRYTRNPMYVGFTFCYLGGAMMLNSWWPFVFWPVCIAALTRLVIQREERYLAEAFGAEYEAYRARVSRWW